jgi:hypothetical protein
MASPQVPVMDWLVGVGKLVVRRLQPVPVTPPPSRK